MNSEFVQKVLDFFEGAELVVDSSELLVGSSELVVDRNELSTAREKLSLKNFEIESEKEVNRFQELFSFSKLKWNLIIIHKSTLDDRKKGMCYILEKGFQISELEKIIKKHNCYYKNYAKEENIYIAPSAENAEFDTIFLDDIPYEAINKYNPIFTIQTSENLNGEKKFQAFYRLSKTVSKEEVKLLQKYLQLECQADPASTDSLHLRRVAGFINNKSKYTNKPFIKIVQQNLEDTLDVEKILEEIKKMEESKKTVTANKIMPQIIFSGNKKKKNKSYIDFITADNDKSRADFKYVQYLQFLNYNDSEISQTLVAETDVVERKGAKHAQEYIKLTIFNARHKYAR